MISTFDLQNLWEYQSKYTVFCIFQAIEIVSLLNFNSITHIGFPPCIDLSFLIE